ncbi:unnamed protein product, partial [Cyprideis torosa]
MEHGRHSVERGKMYRLKETGAPSSRTNTSRHPEKTLHSHGSRGKHEDTHRGRSNGSLTGYSASLEIGKSHSLPVDRKRSFRGLAQQERVITVPTGSQKKSLGEHIYSFIPDHYIPEDIINENGRIGFLFASKAFFQLFVNPVVGIWANKIGYVVPLLMGTFVLFTSSILFAFGRSFPMIFLARSIHGIGSACITVSGMGLIAERFEGEEEERSQKMGFVMGGIAMGVLVGYPFAGIAYFWLGKTTPFICIATLIVINGVVQARCVQASEDTEALDQGTPLRILLKDKLILLTVGAICVSTSAMAILEPCLPIWLMDTIKPSKWQLGTAFVPDSVGYWIGTNYFGVLALKLGRWKVALAAVLLTGLCSMLVPLATSMWHLVLPHFGLGLGIGVVDASLMPMLAYLMELRHSAKYGAVYAIAQTGVCSAYFLGKAYLSGITELNLLGPLFGGQAAKMFGFGVLMRIAGIINILYAPLLLCLDREELMCTVVRQSVPLHLTQMTTQELLFIHLYPQPIVTGERRESKNANHVSYLTEEATVRKPAQYSDYSTLQED